MFSSVKELLVASRNKGGNRWPGMQDIGQLNKLYIKDTASTIINACSSSLMFEIGGRDPDTAQYLAQKVGDTGILETEETVSMGISNYRDGVSIWIPIFLICRTFRRMQRFLTNILLR